MLLDKYNSLVLSSWRHNNHRLSVNIQSPSVAGHTHQTCNESNFVWESAGGLVSRPPPAPELLQGFFLIKSFLNALCLWSKLCLVCQTSAVIREGISCVCSNVWTGRPAWNVIWSSRQHVGRKQSHLAHSDLLCVVHHLPTPSRHDGMST